VEKKRQLKKQTRCEQEEMAKYKEVETEAAKKNIRNV
jgi:hypothetical protein